ncbi:MAG: diguanylate cyclase [Humidesulfovibrio sp.]|uniref:diguanylate cyclase n=1 Tax=Humidesulfovibrio sp. TaxID=2910988 RepID=UPI0027F4EE4A|nr:diguanylate cyclase [Humidesulfovibrio sp.]MDQ7835071.1 diguanylate cyclase [Humidesulfovibrio sp.]
MSEQRVCQSFEVREQLLQAGLSEGTLNSELGQGEQAFADALYLLTRMRFDDSESRCYWSEIISHKEGLALALGRDVGLRVAVCDYFMNLHPRMREPVIVEVQVLLQKERGALVDELTGLYNRRYFNDAIQREVERFKRFGQRFSLLMVDVDHFKRFNDTYGHLAGDDALQSVAGVLRDTARTFDHVVRYGGEEFALILPHTDAEQARAAAERLRQAVERKPVQVQGTAVPLTVSLGTATFPEDAINARDMVGRADEALYEAKITRNRACSYTEKSRQFPRAPLGLTMLFASPAHHGLALRVRNISFGGMLCQSSEAVLPGTRVEVVLAGDHPGAPALRLVCLVVRLERESEGGPYEIALSFEGLGEDLRRALVRLVELEQGGGL